MNSKQIHNKPELMVFRKSLRNNSTSAEATLWKMLKGKQLEGRKFRRQHSVSYYVLDFYCPGERLAVELDGAHHFTEEGMKHDEKRTGYLNSLNIRLIRFENILIFQNPQLVLDEIKKNFQPKSQPSPPRTRRDRL